MIKTIAFLFASVFFNAMAGAHDGPPLLSQPLRVQLNAAVAGPAAEFHLDARESAKYNAVIGFRLLPGAPAQALWKVGDRTPGIASSPVLKFPVRLVITRLADGKVLTDKTLEREELESSNRSELNFSVDQIRLERGEYKVQLYMLRGMDSLEGVGSNFGIYIRRL